ncbi:MAG: hypothetical protein KC582_03440 [Candidatus Magasanikbacteria bacterium]|nr:hypothetical protein [Candidatus Magasanikbacteria bacterium]
MGRPVKKIVEVDRVKAPIEDLKESRRAISMAGLRQTAEVVSKGYPLSEELLDKLDASLDEFLKAFNEVRLSSSERSWDLFCLQQPAYLRRTVHELGLPKRFLDGVIHREFQQCHFSCKTNHAMASDWRKHVLVGDLMGLSASKILRLNRGMRSTIKDVEKILSDRAIYMMGYHPEGWVTLSERLLF